MAEQHDLTRDLQLLEVSLRKLEIEYNMYFAGQIPRPPLETRARVERIIRRYDRAYIQSYADRFRFNSLQARFSSFADLWDRGLRAREEGRPGPFSKPPRVEEKVPAPPAAPEVPAGDRVLCDTTLADPTREREKLLALYDSLLEARKATGQAEALPFHRFAQMVQTQVARLQHGGSTDVAFRVAVKDNKVAFTVRGTKGSGKGEEEKR